MRATSPTLKVVVTVIAKGPLPVVLTLPPAVTTEGPLVLFAITVVFGRIVDFGSTVVCPKTVAAQSKKVRRNFFI
jgi:hypothetical protein